MSGRARNWIVATFVAFAAALGLTLSWLGGPHASGRGESPMAVSYRIRISSPDPAPAVPILVSKELAASKVLGKAQALWPDMDPPISVHVYLLWTSSPYADPGRPVYMVNVDGGYPGPGGVRGGYLVVCGVDANTGEVLTAREQNDRPLGPRPRGAPKPPNPPGR